MQAFTAHQLGHFCRIRALDHALLGDDRIDQVGRGDIEHRVKGFDVSCQALPADLRASVSRVRVWREALGDSCMLDFPQP